MTLLVQARLGHGMASFSLMRLAQKSYGNRQREEILTNICSKSAAFVWKWWDWCWKLKIKFPFACSNGSNQLLRCFSLPPADKKFVSAFWTGHFLSRMWLVLCCLKMKTKKQGIVGRFWNFRQKFYKNRVNATGRPRSNELRGCSFVMQI